MKAILDLPIDKCSEEDIISLQKTFFLNYLLNSVERISYNRVKIDCSSIMAYSLAISRLSRIINLDIVVESIELDGNTF